MEKIKLEILGLSSSQSQQSGSFALVLGEEGRNRRLPIIIGMFEAQAIAIEIEKITSNRPMTHDLFRAFAETFDYDITEIIISDLREGVFYARIVCSDNKTFERFEIDARPSDAIAIGLRFNVPIYTNEAILMEAGIVIDEPEEEISLETQDSTSTTPQDPSAFTNEQLEERLNQALEEENYEEAAKIRDELNRRSA